MDSRSGSQTLWSTQWQVKQWQAGDPDALGRLSQRFAPLVRSRIQGSRTWSRLRTYSSVDDAEQEVWARVLNSGPRSFELREQRHAFVAWLAHLVDSTLIDMLRREERAKRGGGNVPSPLDTAAAAQMLKRPGQGQLLSPTIEARLSEFDQMAKKILGERELKAWRWVVLENYTSGEAALGLDCSAAAVRSLLVRSRSKLQEALKKGKGPDSIDGGGAPA